jgi:hypothetical protein
MPATYTCNLILYLTFTDSQTINMFLAYYLFGHWHGQCQMPMWLG